MGLPNRAAIAPVCRGPITYQGQEDVQRDIADMKAAMAAAGVSDGFLNAVAPGSCARFGNEYYADDEEMLWACADAMREEYVAIVEAGLVLQLDDPAIAENWDQINPAPSVEDYRRFTRKRIEALNYAIRDLPAERIRFHLCWGSWHGPHTTDFPMADLVDIMLEINAGAYSFEAANVRHEHEWKIWRDVKLPEGKVILPGVVSHSTNVIEHPEVVADRIARFAEAVGRENVIASTDCGLGLRCHPQIAWAKLDTLVKGAELATAPALGLKNSWPLSHGMVPPPVCRVAPNGRAHPTVKARKGRSMSTEENKAIVGRWFTEFWGKDFNPAVIDELAAPDIRARVLAARAAAARPGTRSASSRRSSAPRSPT